MKKATTLKQKKTKRKLKVRGQGMAADDSDTNPVAEEENKLAEEPLDRSRSASNIMGRGTNR